MRLNRGHKTDKDLRVGWLLESSLHRRLQQGRYCKEDGYMLENECPLHFVVNSQEWREVGRSQSLVTDDRSW